MMLKETRYPQKRKEFGRLFNGISGREIARYIRQVPAYAHTIKDLIPTQTVRLVFDEHTLEMLKSGARFGHSKYGDLAANLYSNSGELIGQVSFAKELGIEMSSGLSSSINQLLLQQQFGDVIARLDRISADIERVLAGQQNDRIALCASAEQQLLEASKINNDEIRKQILSNALQAAHQARASLTQAFIEDIHFLRDYEVSIFGLNYEKEIKPRTQAIRRSIIANYKAAKVCAMVYAGLDEYPAMIESLSAFGKLLSTQLTDATMEKLNNLDSENTGFWLKEPIRISEEIKRFINSERSLSIEMPVSLIKGVD